MKQLLLCAILVPLVVIDNISWARREALTSEQKGKLEKIDRVFIEVIALSSQGPTDAASLAEVTARRMKEFGYSIVADPAQPHDAELKVKCEQNKTWEGTTTMGSDADLPDSPSRVWKGPACHLTYSLDGRKMAWRKEIRTDFSNAEEAARAANAANVPGYTMAALKQRLEEYDFPALITAEWGQEDRLFKVYDDPTTSPARKAKLATLFGQLFSVKAVPRLLTGLKGTDTELAKISVLALGNIGQKDTIPTLIETMKSGPSELRAAAAKALGILGALHGDFSIIEPLLETLATEDVSVKTEVAWALGKLPDRKAYEPLFTLQKSLYQVREYDSDPKLVKLKEAVNWSIKQIDTWEYLQ